MMKVNLLIGVPVGGRFHLPPTIKPSTVSRLLGVPINTAFYACQRGWLLASTTGRSVRLKRARKLDEEALLRQYEKWSAPVLAHILGVSIDDAEDIRQYWAEQVLRYGLVHGWRSLVRGIERWRREYRGGER